jgi:glycosyltransferase involved in cell wall biosynthesis
MNSLIKVAFFSGPTDYSVCLANALSEYCNINFFYEERYVKKGDASILDILNPAISKLPVNSYRIRDPRNLLSYCNVARKLKNYDIIHVQTANVWLSLYRYIFKKVSVIFTVHDPYQHLGLKIINSKYQDIIQRLIVSQSSVCIVHGKKMKEDLAKRYKHPLERIKVIPHGELSFYRKFKSGSQIWDKKGKNFKRILFFGEIRKNKGLEYLIKAEPFISAKFDNYKICIAGKSHGEFTQYSNLIKEKDKFEIINQYVPNHQVADLFEHSDIVVMPYISATQSGVLSLAFGFGKPVIASNVGSISEVLEDGKSGLLVPPCDEKALANAIIDLLLDNEKCLYFGKNAKECAEYKLGWYKIAKATNQIYKTVLCSMVSNE